MCYTAFVKPSGEHCLHICSLVTDKHQSIDLIWGQTKFTQLLSSSVFRFKDFFSPSGNAHVHPTIKLPVIIYVMQCDAVVTDLWSSVHMSVYAPHASPSASPLAFLIVGRSSGLRLSYLFFVWNGIWSHQMEVGPSHYTGHVLLPCPILFAQAHEHGGFKHAKGP